MRRLLEQCQVSQIKINWFKICHCKKTKSQLKTTQIKKAWMLSIPLTSKYSSLNLSKLLNLKLNHKSGSNRCNSVPKSLTHSLKSNLVNQWT